MRNSNRQIVTRLEVLKDHFNQYNAGICTRSNANIIKDLQVLDPHIIYTIEMIKKDLDKLELLGYIKRVNNGRKSKAKITSNQKFQYIFRESRTIYFNSKGIINDYTNGLESCYNHTQYYKYKYTRANIEGTMYNIKSPDNVHIEVTSKATVLKIIKYWCKLFKKSYSNIHHHIDLIPLNISISKLIKKSNIDNTRFITAGYNAYNIDDDQWMLNPEDHTLTRNTSIDPDN